jgi:alpha-1,2-mannosyltransferase
MPPLPPSYQPWLNPHRLRVQAVCLALCLWGMYAWVIATPGLRDRNGLIKGTDFLHFYTLGMLARAHRGADLYNMPEQTRILGERVPAAANTVYLPLYGPQVSLLFAPFAAPPYGAALVAWWLCSAALYAACVYTVWRTCANLRPFDGTVFICAVAYPAFFHLIAWGQTSTLALACFTAGYIFLRQHRLFAAGLALGCLAFKPQLSLVVVFVFCVTGAWRVVLGAAVAASAQVVCAWLYYGTTVILAYVHQILNIRRLLPLLEPRIEQTHCLRTFWQMLLPIPAVAWVLYVISAAAVLWLALHCWRSTLPFGLRYSALLLATVLISPHLTVYDLVILAPALLLLTDWVAGKAGNGAPKGFALAIYLVYWTPLLGILARWTHLQLSVLAMLALLWMIGSTAEMQRTPVTHPSRV